ncbi:PEP/pyruvate-binding domain-containing protein [Pseudarthrobacter sp. S9]|uniref:PEP/pyruvate-binding domain-containing protein n=1 Tax=Pseudarthrobacter sp. S9 TaxID=3418421 RepID=UPI003D01EC8E
MTEAPAATSPRQPRHPLLVGALADFGAADLAAAGGKGANLGELVRAGFPVPEGFIVTTAAYTALLEDTGLGATLAGLVEAGAGGGAIRDAFASVGVPAILGSAITAAYRQLGGGPVAVRSSATAEDLPGAAFAGQQDTYLNVVGEDALIRAVADCWASLWTDRAISYRERQAIRPDEVAIAVVVQNMVAADTAGVMFSANPVSGARNEILIDASTGLGEAVVSGLVTPEHYTLDARGRLKEWTPGGQEVVIRPATGGGTSETAGTRSTEPMLTSGQIAQLAGIAHRAAAHFGRPQDLEWAVAGGTVHLLQARPMTALPPEPLRLNPFQKLAGPFFVEMFQVRPYPLDVSGWLHYGVLDMVRRMAASVGVVFPSTQELLPEEDGVVLQLVPPVPRPTFRTLGAPVSIARRVRRYNPSRWSQDERFTGFLAESEQLKSQDPRQLGWSQLRAHVRRIFAVTGAITELRVSYLPGAFVPQLRLRLWLLLLGNRRLAASLMAGARTRTSQANRALEELADQVRADGDLGQSFTRLEPAELLRMISDDPRFAEFDRKFRAFLAEYGHRETVSVVLSSAPTWADAQEVVLGLVKALLGQRRQEVDQTGDALRELTAHPALRSGWLRRHVLAAVTDAKTGTAFREDTHFYFTMLLPTLRHSLLEMGERLRAAAVLDQAADVFHLRLEELSAINDGSALPAEDKDRLRKTVLARAAKRRELDRFPLLDLNALFADRKPDSGALLTGTGASRGTATARVRIIGGPADFGKLQSGEIMVCPYTNPSWTPLFQRAAAVVVDTGGIGSHAAIVAREYGIPAVMGTRNGTSTLTDGQRITVDGTTGRVTSAEERH